MRSVGLDLGSRKTTYCEVGNGQVVERATVRAVSDLVRLLGPNTPTANVGFEACREAWHVHEMLTGWGHRALLIDTTRTKLIGIGQHKRKNDRIDAEAIALAVESGRIPQAHLLSPGRREIREQLEVRRALVETRAQYVTTIRGVVRSKEASALPSCKSRHFVAKLEATNVGEHTRALIGPLQSSLVTIEQQLEIVESKLEELCAREPIVLQLSTVPGVGRIVAATFVSVIDEAKRFQGAHQVEAYLGLVPGEDSSGGRRRIGAITKQGNPYARAMLVEAAHCILRLRRGTDPLQRWGEAIEQRRGKRIAVVAVARRLAGLLWAMWRDGTVYEPARLGQKIARGLELQAQTLELRAGALQLAAKKTARRSKARVVAQEETQIT